MLHTAHFFQCAIFLYVPALISDLFFLFLHTVHTNQSNMFNLLDAIASE